MNNDLNELFGIIARNSTEGYSAGFAAGYTIGYKDAIEAAIKLIETRFPTGEIVPSEVVQ